MNKSSSGDLLYVTYSDSDIEIKDLINSEDSELRHFEHPLLLYTASDTIARQYHTVTTTKSPPRSYDLVFFYFLQQRELLINVPLLVHVIESEFQILGQTQVDLCHNFLKSEKTFEDTFKVTRCPVFFRDIAVPAPLKCDIVCGCKCFVCNEQPETDCVATHTPNCKYDTPGDCRLKLPGPLLCWSLKGFLTEAQLSRQCDMASLTDLFSLLCFIQDRSSSGVLVLGTASVDPSFIETWPI